jgi:hypothetical protein
MVVVKNGYSEYPFCKGANPESIVGREGQEIRGDQPRAICVEHSKKNIDQPYLKISPDKPVAHIPRVSGSNGRGG